MADEMIEVPVGLSKRAKVLGSVFVVLFLIAVVPQLLMKDWLCANPWLKSALVDGPGFLAMIIAWFELRHSGEANELQKIANAYRNERNTLQVELNAVQMGHNTLQAERNALLVDRNDLQERANQLQEELGKKQVEHLGIMAERMKREPTKAEKNADLLRNKYFRQMTSVTQEGQPNNSPVPYEIVEVNEDNIVTLFYRTGQPGATGAYYNRADCNELTIDPRPHGSCTSRIHVQRFLGQAVNLGSIMRWEDHNKASAVPVIEKGQIAWYGRYGKGGTGEIRQIHIYQGKDGSNEFILEANPGDPFVGNNEAVSRRCMNLHVDFLMAGFTRQHGGDGEIKGGHKLFIC